MASAEAASTRTYDYDLAVIGAGPGGYSTALRAAELGLKVALVEKDPHLGGTCLNRGCIPTKALLTAAHARRNMAQADFWGISVDPSAISLDTAALHERKRSLVSSMVSGLENLVKARKITRIQGTAHLLEPHAVGTKEQRIKADQIVLALGSQAVELPWLPFGGPILDSDMALAEESIPGRVAIVGSGAIALEFATYWNALGSEVTVFLRKDRPLSHGDKRTTLAVMRGLTQSGIRFIPHAQVTQAVPLPDSRLDLSYGQSDSRSQGQADGPSDDPSHEQSLTVDRLLVAVGRAPRTDLPGLDLTQVHLDPHGFVLTDPYGRTDQGNIWAVGDIRAGHQLAHRAFGQGIAVAESIAFDRGLLSRPPRPVDEHSVPQVVYSEIEYASVGYTKDEGMARPEEFFDVRETAIPLLSNSRVLMEQASGNLTLVTGKLTARKGGQGADTVYLLGAHIAGPRASEMISEAQQIIANRIPLHLAASLIHPHPTISESLGEALLKADGRPLHLR
ncbi:dihydrolipoamide dehydrogenase [Parascardovia denticolens IPLA 20019]|uniref:FAD-dependent oxidoreductase n=1 Tax=Parascardovia denticolens TaxID=78258 RepID=UPI000266A972|nr:FAD-dependent oxidoreductase [Parascardovia denticolens]EIT88018.1 dihydrolipoamide dehydrogenase [Parascardovia denticolens IPLA 20019]